MDFQEYQKQSILTKPDLAETYGFNELGNPFKLFNKTSTMNNFNDLSYLINSIHMSLGMCSELSEVLKALDKANKVDISEELADICWYVSGEFNIIKHVSDFTFTVSENNDTSILNSLYNSLVYDVVEYSDIVKKELAYRKIKDKHEKVAILHDILTDINSLANFFEIDMEVALQNNIDKLQKKRYQNGFNEKDAVNRDLEGERKELEKNQ